MHAARGGGRHHGGVGGYGAPVRGGGARRARSNGTRGTTEYAAGGSYGKVRVRVRVRVRARARVRVRVGVRVGVRVRLALALALTLT